MASFILSPEAEEDLQDVFLFSLENWGEPKARDYIFSLYDTFETIGASPQIGRARLELGSDVRSLLHRSHLIYYTVLRDTPSIIRVLHTSRDVEVLFRG